MQRKSLLTLSFLSGFSALAYEICWVRQATLTFGVSIYAYSAVLTAYMGGMAVGGYLIGRRADGVARPLRLFAWLQIGMAGLGLLVPFALDGLTALYAGVVRGLALGLTALTALRLGMSLLVLAPPAVCIGATLPVMSRAFARHSGRVGRDVAVLQDLGGPEQISRYWIMNSEQLREYAGSGDPVHDNDAFFLPIDAETEHLVGITQLAAMLANP